VGPDAISPTPSRRRPTALLVSASYLGLDPRGGSRQSASHAALTTPRFQARCLQPRLDHAEGRSEVPLTSDLITRRIETDGLLLVQPDRLLLSRNPQFRLSALCRVCRGGPGGGVRRQL
jgi:hypothetical protein